jgi:hypothetical protein
MFMNAFLFGQSKIAQTPGPARATQASADELATEVPPIQRVQSGATVVDDTQTDSAWTMYGLFFEHLASLDEVADEQAAAGNADAATGWRTHEQHAAGLSDEEGKILKQAAYDCNQAVKNQDAKIQAAISAFHDQYPNGQFLSIPLPPELIQLDQDRIAIINSQIDQLRLGLGDESFQKLDSYIQANFQAPVQVTPNPPGPMPPTTSPRGGQ